MTQVVTTAIELAGLALIVLGMWLWLGLAVGLVALGAVMIWLSRAITVELAPAEPPREVSR